ncbi:GPW/gp25 family protein [Pantoea sp. MQR6]|uniref:GPW/gp25 family protein n=1 Tax=Pantoea sp. MQR6 TaxID=2907307 RepID=UPI001FA9C0CC|nr:GPW/gp25 family protein [Pantoea sp. MQR6]
MTMYTGMNQQTGKAITDADHIRQSVRDILLTPEGSRIARREYGSLLFKLIDDPQNPATKLQVMAATYSALSRWEPRITLDTINITSAFDGSMVVELTGRRSDGAPLSLFVATGVNSGSN